MFSGGYLAIDESEEAALVRALQVRGFAVFRDDDIVGRLAW